MFLYTNSSINEMASDEFFVSYYEEIINEMTSKREPNIQRVTYQPDIL